MLPLGREPASSRAGLCPSARAPSPTCQVLSLLHGGLPTLEKSTGLKRTESGLEHSD